MMDDSIRISYTQLYYYNICISIYYYNTFKNFDQIKIISISWYIAS